MNGEINCIQHMIELVSRLVELSKLHYQDIQSVMGVSEEKSSCSEVAEHAAMLLAERFLNEFLVTDRDKVPKKTF